MSDKNDRIEEIGQSKIIADLAKYNAKLSSMPQNHGIYAERANDLLYPGSTHVGSNNLKNGPDRISYGQNIQSKYCENPTSTLSKCFEKGQYKYLNANGTPMILEVPADQYESVLLGMQERIKRGQVPGITNPKIAKLIVRKGFLTYTQALNIAKAGTIESIIYDSCSGIKVSTTVMGLSALVFFISTVSEGEDIEKALKAAIKKGAVAGGATLSSNLLVQQVSRIKAINNLLLPYAQKSINCIPQDVVNKAAKIALGRAVTGKAARSAVTDLLKSNIVTGVIVTGVQIIPDLYRFINGDIDGKELADKATQTAGTVAGGLAGSQIGAIVGAIILPGLGVIIGSAVGSIVGSTVGNTVACGGEDSLLIKYLKYKAAVKSGKSPIKEKIEEKIVPESIRESTTYKVYKFFLKGFPWHS